MFSRVTASKPHVSVSVTLREPPRFECPLKAIFPQGHRWPPAGKGSRAFSLRSGRRTSDHTSPVLDMDNRTLSKPCVLDSVNWLRPRMSTQIPAAEFTLVSFAQWALISEWGGVGPSHPNGKIISWWEWGWCTNTREVRKKSCTQRPKMKFYLVKNKQKYSITVS